MAIKNEVGMAELLRAMPAESATAIAKQFAGLDLAKVGKVRVFPLGKPAPDDWTVSVLPHSSIEAKLVIEHLLRTPGRATWEVFPYGILNPEIGRIDIRSIGR